VATKRGHVLLVRRRRDRLRMFPGGRKQGRESEKDCLEREIFRNSGLAACAFEGGQVANRLSGRKVDRRPRNEDCIAHLVERLIFGAGALPRPKIARKRR